MHQPYISFSPYKPAYMCPNPVGFTDSLQVQGPALCWALEGEIDESVYKIPIQQNSPAELFPNHIRFSFSQLPVSPIPALYLLSDHVLLLLLVLSIVLQPKCTCFQGKTKSRRKARKLVFLRAASVFKLDPSDPTLSSAIVTATSIW